jgi:hypothetical protein
MAISANAAREDSNNSFVGTANRAMPGYRTGTGSRLLSTGFFRYECENDGSHTRKTKITRARPPNTSISTVKVESRSDLFADFG